MLTILTTFHILAAVAIIALVLLQQGKGADAGAAFGAGGSGTVFGARGAASFLTRTTAVLALVFFITSLGLAWFASQQVERRSVVERIEVPLESERASASPADVPNAASDVPRESISCTTLEQIEKEMNKIRRRYGEYSDAVVEANARLPGIRRDILNRERVCSPRIRDRINSTIRLTKKVDILSDKKAVNALAICIDHLTTEIDRDISEATTTIRLQRLGTTRDKLLSISEKHLNVDRALLRGISKRKRLLEELGQFDDEITDACPEASLER